MVPISTFTSRSQPKPQPNTTVLENDTGLIWKHAFDNTTDSIKAHTSTWYEILLFVINVCISILIRRHTCSFRDDFPWKFNKNI